MSVSSIDSQIWDDDFTVATSTSSITAADTSDDIEDDELSTHEASPSTMSVTSSVYAHSYENGRRYHSYKYGRYPIPNDDLEQTREEMVHAAIMELTDGVLFYAPIGDYPMKIADIGTGTGKNKSPF